MSHSRAVRTVAAAALLVGVGTAGCTEPAAKPKPLPSPSSSSVADGPTSSPTATPPSMPAKARGTSTDAAKRFVRFYVLSINHASRTGDTSIVKRFSAPGCRSCAAVSGSISDIYAHGDHLVGKGWQVTAIQAVSHQPRLQPILQVGLIIHAQKKVTADGTVSGSRSGGRKLLIVSLHRAGGQWLVERLEQAA